MPAPRSFSEVGKIENWALRITSINTKVIMLPVLLVGMLQLGGCSAQRPSPPPPPGGIYISESAGARFDQSVALEGEEGNIAGLNFSKAFRLDSQPNVLFVTAGSRGLAYSANGGRTWKIIGTPLTNTSDVIALPQGVIIISGSDGTGQGYIMRSADLGKSWETVLTIPLPVDGGLDLIGTGKATPAIVISLAPDPFNPTRVYAGTNLGNIFAGEQYAKTWRKLLTLSDMSIFGGSSGRASYAIRTIIPSPHTAGEFLVITADKNLYQISQEKQLQLKVAPPAGNQQFLGLSQKELNVLSASFIKEHPQALIVGVDDGAVITRDGGATWQRLPLPIDVVKQFNSSVVAVSPTNPSRILVAINDVVYRSEDGGFSWITSSLDLRGFIITDLLIDPSNPAYVIAVTSPARS